MLTIMKKLLQLRIKLLNSMKIQLDMFQLIVLIQGNLSIH